ncbi:MAG: hypothetical protein GY913_13015 [Proteobacteria bacterium]|nr:hypothetical protein [Pseudomonadota bacterium]MCP4917828.1 hypothetical protein [Pseudomonadota bacterium]
MGLWLLGLALAGSPSEQTLVYYNARMALREGRPEEALRLWMLRNAVEDETGRVSVHDPDFHSVAWAALGELGVCQDGHRTDEEGAGLWSLALHNWVVRNMGRKASRPTATPFDAFELDRQQRFVSVNDVLDPAELLAVRFFRGPCALPRTQLIQAGERPRAKLSDRQVAARLLRYLLQEAKPALQDVRGMAAIDARLFDLDLQLTELAAREARKEELEATRRGRALNLLSGSLEALREQVPDTTLDPETEAARILEDCVDWPVSEWMVLSPDRRLFLFGHARAQGGDADKLDAIALGVLDELIDAQDGKEVQRWIARYGSPDLMREPIWSGERGARLLAVDAEAGFDERGVIALHRGLHHVETGDLPEALRSLAYALQYAPESRDAETVENLSLRWLSFVASQFEITDELMVTLRELVPRREYAVLLEDLMWRAALRADHTSFTRGQAHQPRRTAMERRLFLLEPLATGDMRAFDRLLDTGLKDSPNETMQFLELLLGRLELEDEQVRAAHIPTLETQIHLLQPFLEIDQRGRAPRRAGELVDRSQAILEGLGALEPSASAQQRGHALASDAEVYVGSLRLAPSDPLPWPFPVIEPAAPSVFVPLELTPIEWEEDGELVFGWRLGG